MTFSVHKNLQTIFTSEKARPEIWPKDETMRKVSDQEQEWIRSLTMDGDVEANPGPPKATVVPDNMQVIENSKLPHLPVR